VVGGGFGGLTCARALRRARGVRLELVDKRNFHLFQPLLYQVATGGLSPANIAAPLRRVLARQKNCHVVLGEVTGLDPSARTVRLADGATLPYDDLVVAAGARSHYFGNDGWEERAPSLKTLEDALEIRRRVLRAFEAAERETDPELRREWLTFVVAGGGPTGVEMAGALAEMARYTLPREFRVIDPARARVVLVEGADEVLPGYPGELPEKAGRFLERLDVEVRRGTLVSGLDVSEVTLKDGDAPGETVRARTVVWAAGVKAVSLGTILAEATGAETDRMGRVVVGPDLSVPGHENVFVIGDLAHCRDKDGDPLPGIAPVAMQQGEYVARIIRARARGKASPSRAFSYKDRGIMATVGRKMAVARIGRFHFAGFFAWLMWLLVHLLMIVTYESRILVLIQWGFNYVTFSRNARLITEGD